MRRYANLHQCMKGGQAKESKLGPFYRIVMKWYHLQEILQKNYE